MPPSKARVIFVCGREPEYIRNRMIWQTVNRHFDSCLIADSRPGSLTFRLVRLWPRLMYHLRRPHDLLVVGFYGHPLVILARRLTRSPILFDAFVSTYDTLCFDRQIISAESWAGRLAFQLDESAGHAADKVILDTQTHAAYFQETFGLPAPKTETLYLGYDQASFNAPAPPTSSEKFTVFSYSTYLPLHGADVIVEAAHRCRDYPIRFRLVGSQGQTYRQTRQLATKYRLANIEFIPTLPFGQLVKEISKATICLGGHFGATPKASRVIAGKTYQFIAFGKPVILGDNPANKELFDHTQTAYLCHMNNPNALAEAIIHLYENQALRYRLSKKGYQFFYKRLTWGTLGEKLVNIIEEML